MKKTHWLVDRCVTWLGAIDGVFWVLIAVLIVLILRRAWIGDDAYITLRTIDNWVNGYGPNFNVSERVQAYTHPLWMLLLASVYAVSREPYYTTLAVCLLSGAIAIVLFFRHIPKNPWAGVMAAMVLICSNAFIDWSTSGLENPLSFLLLVLFMVKYFSVLHHPKPRDVFVLSLLSSLAMLNRLDTGVVYLPMLTFAWILSEPRIGSFLHALLGQTPIILWEMFSLFYYGFPFPNTYYAKLHTGLESSEIYSQGWIYYLDTLHFDPVTLLAIFTAIVIACMKKERKTLFPLALGIVFYLAYILGIGGDFMSGRFFSLPLFASAIILARIDFSNIQSIAKYAIASVLLLNVAGPLPTYSLSDATVRDLTLYNTRITNERLWYDQTMGLLQQNRIDTAPFSPLRLAGQEFKRLAGEERWVTVENAIGMQGFYGGPNVHLIDLNALSEPFLARLPMVYNQRWRPAHYIRWEEIEGYIETVESLENKIRDPGLKTYYGYLSQIIHGDLWSIQRIRTIANMNLGRFDHLIDDFSLTYPEIIERSYSHVNNTTPLPMECSAQRGIQFKENGILVRLPEEVRKSTHLEIALENHKRFQILFLLEKVEVAKLEWFPGVTIGVTKAQRFEIPQQVSQSGFDQLLILPLEGEPQHCLIYVILE